MITSYLTFFIAFQVMCLIFATGFTVSNVIKLRHSPWFVSYCFYLASLAVHTFRRGMVFLQGNPAATATDAMIWQTIIAVGFLLASGTAYTLLHHKK